MAAEAYRSRDASPPQSAAQSAQNQEEAITEEAQGFWKYFRWRPLPWWLCFLTGIFLLTKLQIVYNDSPCAVLGIQSPVTSADLKKAFRTLSMCTHPDRLRGRLGRQPTAAESRRGEIIFSRASAAKEELTKMLRHTKSKELQCYQGELELAVFGLFKQVGQALSALGLNDYFEMGIDLLWNLVTFEAGFFNTLLSILWMSFLFKLVKQFLTYLWRMGIINGSIAFVTTVVIGPIPTIVHFFVLPLFRLVVFCRTMLKEYRPDLVPDQQTSSEEADSAATNVTASVAAKAANKDLPARHIRQRKKKESDEEVEQKKQALLTGEEKQATANKEQAENQAVKVTPMPDSAWQCVMLSQEKPVNARQNAANAVQFDLLLILTKPVIPLIMLISLGQVWNGLISSMIVSHLLRKWVPQMSYEAHHLLCTFFGAVHTLLGVTASQVEDYANSDTRKVLHLAWSWSLKDVLSVMHMCQLGAVVTGMSAMGNEPSFAASFASGLALRIALGQDSFQGSRLGKIASEWFQGSLKDLGVSLDAAEEVVASSGGGIGDCGGGPFRMLFGDGPMAGFAATALKVWLLLIPTMSAAQWFMRTVQAGKMLGKRWKLTRFIQRLILCVLGFMQIFLFASFELNASNGALGNFWVAMMIGCVGESLLSTYDVRGPVRQIIFLLLFLFI
eukprot:TRINITY_DN108196_c0_g1_i1.p1 TRINITY_DN108196_c0_g1~~TRINITY_DN108196_c0_g1_i1.p1  ORF type:complete len:684 (-),score=127.37 TRINITY_DN108196_c0_g1_i1:20-2038(-)